MWFAAFLLFFQADYTSDGMKALEESRYSDAVTAFTKAVAADPKDYFAHFNLAMAHTLLHHDDEAVAEYRKTLEIKPRLYEAELNGGIVLLRQKNPAEALPLLEDAAGQKPAEFRARYYLAEAQLQTGGYSQAGESFRKALAADPKSAGANLGMAQSLVQEGRLSDAEPFFRQAAQIDANYRAYLLQLAGLYEKANQPAEAVAVYREFPDNPAAQSRLGELLLESKKYSDALPRLEEAYQQNPSPANRVSLAAAYVFTQQGEKALPLLEQAVAAAPADFDIRMMYARTLRDRRKFAPAAQQFYEAAKLKPGEIKPWTELGGMLYMGGDYPQALAAFEQAAKLGDASAGNWFLRAIILDKLRQLKPARAAYEQFLAVSQGKNPDQEFQARQRVRILDREIARR
ncbi:MAG TPA: tetratricopeptide repeat protein [Candidatus Acidoferrales bacterium]|nr:tetratricopeptide repeat protein [Candidatus Acidoferrales bacterium]